MNRLKRRAQSNFSMFTIGIFPFMMLCTNFLFLPEEVSLLPFCINEYFQHHPHPHPSTTPIRCTFRVSTSTIALSSQLLLFRVFTLKHALHFCDVGFETVAQLFAEDGGAMVDLQSSDYDIIITITIFSKGIINGETSTKITIGC